MRKAIARRALGVGNSAASRPAWIAERPAREDARRLLSDLQQRLDSAAADPATLEAEMLPIDWM